MTAVALRPDDLVWHDIDGDVIVLDTQENVYLSLSGSGALVWRRLAEGATQVDLRDLLVTNYGISTDQADADVNAFLQMLRDRSLLAS